MALDPVKNFAKATLINGISSTDTSLQISDEDASKFPDPSTDGAFNVILWNATDYPDPSDDPDVEIVRVTAKSSSGGTTTYTITRGQEGTTAKDHNTSGKTYKIVLGITKKMIDDIESNATGGTDLFAPNKHSLSMALNQNTIYSTVSGSGEASGSNYLYLHTGTTNNSTVLAQHHGFQGGSWTKAQSWALTTYRIVTAADTYMFWGIGNHEESPSTYKRIGFKAVGTTIYATVFDGSTETTVDITSNVTTGASLQRFVIEYDGSSKVEFYVDGTLVATITTGLPTGTIGKSTFTIFLDNKATTSDIRIDAICWSNEISI